MATSTAIRGTIRTLQLSKGFGFIKPDSGGADIFFHLSKLQGLEFNEQLRERDVMCTSEETGRGPRAVRVWATT